MGRGFDGTEDDGQVAETADRARAAGASLGALVRAVATSEPFRRL